MEGVGGVGLVEGEVSLGEREVLGDGLVPLLGAEAHLGVGGVGNPGAGPVGDGEGEAGGEPRGPDEHRAGACRLGVLHRHRELRAAVPRRRRGGAGPADGRLLRLLLPAGGGHRQGARVRRHEGRGTHGRLPAQAPLPRLLRQRTSSCLTLQALGPVDFLCTDDSCGH